MLKRSLHVKQFMLYTTILAILIGFVATAQAQTGDQLAATADVMTPGTWARVPQNSSIDNVVACKGDVDYPTQCNDSRNRITAFTYTAGWDYNRHILHVVSEDHGNNLYH